MSHVDEGTLHAYLDGELSPTETQGVDAHLAQCPACRERLDVERALITRAGELLALATPPDRQLPPFRAGDLKPPTRLWWQVRLPLAWAATVALALGIGTYLGESARAPLAPVPLVRPNEIADRPAPIAAAPDTVVQMERQRRAEPRARRSQPSAPAAVGVIAEEQPQKRAHPVADSTAMRGATALNARDEAPAAPERPGLAAKAAAPAPSHPEALRLGDRGYVLKDRAITADSARLVLGRDPLVVADLPIRGIYRGRMLGYSGLVIVEQALDSSTVIAVINGRAVSSALQEVVVSGAGVSRADTVSAEARALLGRTADSAAPAARQRETPRAAPMDKAEPTPAFIVDVQGPVSADSLATLRRLLRPLRR